MTESYTENARKYIPMLEALLHEYRRTVMELQIRLGDEPTGQPLVAEPPADIKWESYR